MTVTTVYNEGSTVFVTPAYTDQAGAPFVPTSAQYRVDAFVSDLPSWEARLADATKVIGWTAFTPGSVINLPPSVNTVITGTRKWELRQVLVKALDSSGNQAIGQTVYALRRLVGQENS